MMQKKIFLITLFIFFSSLTNSAYSDTLNFGSSTYDGDVKKGKAHGDGIFTFSDGSKYEGKFKKNKIHGKGKYTDLNGNIFEGKWRYGKFSKKIDKNTRETINLSVEVGNSSYFEIRGKAEASNKWFEAEKNSSGTYELTAKGEKDMNKAIEEAKGDGGSSAGGGCGG